MQIDPIRLEEVSVLQELAKQTFAETFAHAALISGKPSLMCKHFTCEYRFIELRSALQMKTDGTA
ncbi:hypothetical protein LI88_04890 [Streptococcus suis]|nr:hypothetical protein LI88_04890 [Streptococcus suis]